MKTYTNPVYPHSFPDPFVLRFNGRYYAFGTGPSGDGRFFPILSSKDLVTWEAHGGALEPLALEGAEQYWAPEVAYTEGRFYMYYATGRTEDPDHHLRLATAEHPLGPWRDAGLNLTPHEIFAIDGHPFRDPRDGQWYLFYARDVLTAPYAGTGAAVDRLVAMDRLEGKPRDVLRPYADWQVFELNRAVKQGLDWYTIEGPFVLPVGDRYVCFYSGGRWENPNYGVGHAHADHPLGPWVDDTHAQGPQILTTVPGKVIGPGHNSVATGPDLVTQYLVYHGWDPAGTARTMRIDPLLWTDGHPRCDGPSIDPRPAPRMPDRAAWFDEEDPGPEWERAGSWQRDGSGLHARGSGALLRLSEPQEEFVLEVGLRGTGRCGGFGASVGDTLVSVFLGSDALHVGEHFTPLPPNFRREAWHRLLIRRSGSRLTAVLDDYPTLTIEQPSGASTLALLGGAGASFSHYVLRRL